MRKKQEMMQLILGVAQNDERIRAVYMNGSRTNKNANKDIFQDYDIVYIVKDTKPFIEDQSWIDVFGERMYMQRPEQNNLDLGLECDFASTYGWLIQFKDGNRLDLHVDTNIMNISLDKLCVILLDKDNILPKIPESSDEDYHVKKPREVDFLATCNEFWWCLNNIVKGLWREEIPYVQDMYHYVVQPQLIKLLNWKIGYETNFSVSTGKSSKYMYRWLPADVWERFLKTYINGNLEDMWNSTCIMCDLFNEIAREICQYDQFTYNEEEAKGSYDFLKHVRELPKDAKDIY